ncbi:MAG: aldo/keto reductase [Chloroflexi bacterium]|nr:MAG: aldo/keto reductase [Chloroflexota bacterium]
MKHVLLGRTGVRVSELCFGTMTFGNPADEESSRAMFNRCLDVGINFFDCANVYAGGRSEEILGRLMKGQRDDLVITSKVYGNMSGKLNGGGLSRRHIVRAVEDSLRRLDTDRLDLYFVHQMDANTPIEETVRALDDLVSAGKILYPAVSNWASWQIMKALGIAEREMLARFECIQPMYNLVKRQVEVEVLPLAQSEELGVIAYSPLGAGLLTGKYGRKDRPAAGRLQENPMYVRRYSLDWYYDTAEDFVTYAGNKGFSPVSLAVAWVLSHPAVTAPIIGARNLEQLQPSLDAVNIVLTPEMRAEISAFSPTPPPATDRLEEQVK